MHEPQDAVDATGARPAILWGAKPIGEYLGLTEPTTRHLIDRGVIPAFKLAGRWVARPKTLDAWLARRERTALRACERELVP